MARSTDGMAGAHQFMAVRDEKRYLSPYQILIEARTARIRSVSPQVLDGGLRSGLRSSSRAPVHVLLKRMEETFIVASFESKHSRFDVGDRMM